MEGVLNQLFVIIYLRGMDDCSSVFCYLDISSAVRIIYSVSARISSTSALLTLSRHHYARCKSRTLAMMTCCAMVWRRVAFQAGAAVAAGSAIAARSQVFV